LTDERAAQFLRRMWEIRAFEEATERLFTSGQVRGSTHLCQGQETVVVGACEALRDGDSMLCTYRSGAVLAALRHAEVA
jgi:pyruvate dehydrogenase E1 component alpha subunit